MKRRIPSWFLGAAVFVCPAYAWAEDPAAAEALFKEAVSKYKEGKFVEACPAFAESQRLDPRPGTLFALAECEAAADHIATAATLYEDFLRTVASIKSPAQRAKYQDRVQKAQTRRDELVPLIPRLTLVLPTGSSPDVRITRNGETFTATSLGVEMPVNPGEQVITVQIASGPVREQRLAIGRGDKQTITLELPPPPPEAPVVPYEEPLPVRAPEKPQPLRTVGFVVGGVGVVGVLTGIVAGSMIIERSKSLDDDCPLGKCRTQEALDNAKSLAPLNLVNGVGLGVGGAAVVAGILMTTLGRHPSRKEAMADVHWGAFVTGQKDFVVGVKGAF